MKQLIALLASVALVGSVSACGIASDLTESDSSPGVIQGGPSTTGSEPAPGSAADTSVDETTRPGAPATEDRSVVRTAVMTVGTEDPVAAGRRAESTAVAMNGYVESVSTEGSRSATVVLRVPSERYDDALASLRDQGEVRSLEVTADDVTAGQADLDARIRAQRASVARVQDLMRRAGTLSEVVQVEQELASRQSELESLESQRARLADQVAMATITSTFTASGDSSAPGWWSPAGDALVAAWQGLVVVVAALSPLIVLAAVAAAAALAIVRRTRRRRSESTTAKEPVA